MKGKKYIQAILEKTAFLKGMPFFWRKKKEERIEMMAEKIDRRKMIKHETKRHVLIKFFLVLLVFVSYFLFISQKYGYEDGLMVSFLTWSFFVLCTPIADAGFLIDFPLRYILNVRMFIAEMFVWITAISLNTYSFFFAPQMYDSTKILILFQHILAHPFPFWSIIVISGVGTFLSVQFGDELLDNAHYRQDKLPRKHALKYRMVLMAFVFILSLLLYDFLLKKLGVQVPI